MATTLNQTPLSVLDNTNSNLNNLRANLLRSGLNNLDWPKNKSAKIVVLGLSGAGKTTLIEFLQKGAIENNKRRPTISFSFHQCDFGKLKAIFVDVPGQELYWANWKSYMKGADGVIFMIDATKLSDVAKAYSVYLKTMKSSESVPVAILANKQDVKGSLSSDSISSMMMLGNNSMITKSFDTIALTGKGLHDALVWLLKTSNNRFKN